MYDYDGQNYTGLPSGVRRRNDFSKDARQKTKLKRSNGTKRFFSVSDDRIHPSSVQIWFNPNTSRWTRLYIYIYIYHYVLKFNVDYLIDRFEFNPNSSRWTPFIYYYVLKFDVDHLIYRFKFDSIQILRIGRIYIILCT